MTSHNTLKKLFAATVLSAGLAFTFSPANAAPRNDVKAAKKEVKQEKKDVKKAQKQVRKADSPQERREARQDVREERRDVKDARQDVREEKRDVHNNNNNGNWNNNNSNKRTFTGTVIGVSSNRRFQLRVGNQTFDVSSSSQLPRGFDRNDIVRVYGTRSGNNDIVNSSVSIINNR